MPGPRDDNPYLPPTASLTRPEPDPVDEKAVSLRLRGLGHEAALRALGITHFAGAGLDVAGVAIASYYTLRADGIWSGLDHQGRVICLAHLYLATPALIGLHLILGRDLPRLRPRAFRAQWILSGLAIAVFFLSWALQWAESPNADFLIATAILQAMAHFAILYYLIGSSCRRVIAPDYREAVAATPHLRARLGWPLLAGIVPLSIAAEWGLLDVANKLSWMASLLPI